MTSRVPLTCSIIACATIAMLAGQVPAFAATISENTGTPVTQNAFDLHGNLTLALPDFNPALGTLTSAVLTLDVFTGPQFEVIDIGPTDVCCATGTGSTLVTYTVTGTGVSALSGSASSGTQTVTLLGTPGQSSFLDLASSPPVYTFLDPSVTLTDLAGVTGSGMTSFNVGELFTTSGTSRTVVAALAFGGSASANLGLAVVYTYDPVPEPMSIMLLGTGLIGLSAIRRRPA